MWVGVFTIGFVQLIIIAFISVIIYVRISASAPPPSIRQSTLIVDDEEQLLNQILERSRKQSKQEDKKKKMETKANIHEDPDILRSENLVDDSKTEIVKIENVDAAKKAQEEVEDAEDVPDRELRLRKKGQPKDQEKLIES